MSLIGKAAIFTTTAGAIGVTGAYAGGLFDSPKKEETLFEGTLKGKLKREGFTVLDTKQKSTDWETVLIEYKKAIANSFTGRREENKKEEDLRADCEKALSKIDEGITNYRENKDFTRAMQWCVKKENIDTVLGKARLRVVNFQKQDDSTEKQFIEVKIERLKKESNKGFNALKSLEGSTIGNSDQVNVENLKKGCESLKTNQLNTTDDKFLNNFYLAKEYCFVNS